LSGQAEPLDLSRRVGNAYTLLIVHPEHSEIQSLIDSLAAQDYRLELESPSNLTSTYFQTHSVDLILVDAIFAIGQREAFCQRLKRNRLTRDIPMIVVGDREPDAIAHAFDAGASDYISPPFHDAEVTARINYHLEGYHRRLQLSQQNALLLAEVRERKQVENALRETEGKYRRIFEHATEGIFQTSESGKFISVNPALATIYGYDSPEDLINSITDVGQQLYVQPKRRDELVVYLKQYDHIIGAESEVYRKDGSTIWISETIRKVYDDGGAFSYYEGIVHDITESRRIEMELRQQRKQADSLLVNILPYQIAARLKLGARTIAENFDHVTVLFADLVEFTAASHVMEPKQLVELLNEIFSDFDRLAEQHGLEKIKTIGDAYMAAAGLPVPRPDHADAVAHMALDMQQTIGKFTRPDGTPFKLRIGINTGPVIAGVIGVRRFAYDLWGDTVNIASRMETAGAPDRIQVTPEVYEQLKHRFLFEPRGEILIKGRGPLKTYWLINRRHQI